MKTRPLALFMPVKAGKLSGGRDVMPAQSEAQRTNTQARKSRWQCLKNSPEMSAQASGISTPRVSPTASRSTRPRRLRNSRERGFVGRHPPEEGAGKKVTARLDKSFVSDHNN
jgi:hypothetical protein